MGFKSLRFRIRGVGLRVWGFGFGVTVWLERFPKGFREVLEAMGKLGCFEHVRIRHSEIALLQGIYIVFPNLPPGPILPLQAPIFGPYKTTQTSPQQPSETVFDDKTHNRASLSRPLKKP